MPTVYALVPDIAQQYFDDNGELASGYQMFVYEAGTTTKATSYQTSAGTTPNTNPIILNARGELPYGIYVETGTYKLVFTTDTDTDPPTSPVWTRDNLTPSNDVVQVGTVDEWTASNFTPTFIDADSFSVTGDGTATFTVGRRVKITDSGGTDYGVVTASTFGGAITTVDVTLDAGSIDSGISVVEVGFLQADNSSIPHIRTAEEGLTVTGDLSVSGSVSFGDLATRGDLPYVDANGDLAALSVGTAGQVLRSDGTDPTWSTAGSNTGYSSVGTGTTYDITGIPSWVSNIVVVGASISTSGSSDLLLQLGDAGGFETTGYTGTTVNPDGTTQREWSSTTGAYLAFIAGASAANTVYAHLVLADSTTNLWVMNVSAGLETGNGGQSGCGHKALSATLTQLRLTMVNGTDTFDGGNVNAVYW